MIFDRDGVLNVDHGYVVAPERWEWMLGARRAIARLNAAGMLAIVATNQSGVARGYFPLAAVEQLHARMERELAAAGARLDAIYLCPELDPAHPDRKPNPGMIRKALADFALDPDETLVVGDKESDLEAARRAGTRGVLYGGGDLEAFLAELGVF